MSTIITYDEYQEMGGLIKDKHTFSVLELKAERLARYWTQDRLTEATEGAKCLIKDMIDKMDGWNDGERISSFSNGKVNFSFDLSKSETQELYDLLPMYLRPDIIYRGAEKCE